MTIPSDKPTETQFALDCQSLSFSFAEGSETVLKGVDLQLERGARCLLVGANGGESSSGHILLQSTHAYYDLSQPASRPFCVSSPGNASPRPEAARAWVKMSL